MSDLKDVFDNSVSKILDNDKKEREEAKAKLEEVGVKEILEYIIERVNLPDDEKNENDKAIEESLICIARNKFYQKENISFGGNFKEASLGIYEVKEFFYFNLCLSFGEWYGDNYRWYASTKSVLSVSLSKEGGVFIYYGGDDKRKRAIPIEKGKMLIAKEIIEFILAY
jgi:hypothetical protein